MKNFQIKLKSTFHFRECLIALYALGYRAKLGVWFPDFKADVHYMEDTYVLAKYGIVYYNKIRKENEFELVTFEDLINNPQDFSIINKQLCLHTK